MAATTRFRYPLTTRADQHALLAAVTADLHRYGLLLTGGEPSRAEHLTVATFAWLADEIRSGRQTVTPGRLRLAMRRAAVPATPSTRRERERAVTDTLGTARSLAEHPPPSPVALLEAMPVRQRHAFVVRWCDALPEPDVAAVVHLPEPVTAELLALGRAAWARVDGPERSGRPDLDRLDLPEPSRDLSGRIWAWMAGELDAAPADTRRTSPVGEPTVGPIEWLPVRGP